MLILNLTQKTGYSIPGQSNNYNSCTQKKLNTHQNEENKIDVLNASVRNWFSHNTTRCLSKRRLSHA